MLDDNLIDLIRDYGLPLSQTSMFLEKIDATVKYIDSTTKNDSIIHFGYDQYRKEVKKAHDRIIFYAALFPLLGAAIIYFLSIAYDNYDNASVWFFMACVVFVIGGPWLIVILKLAYDLYLRYKYACKIKTYLNYLDYKNNLEKRGVNNFDYYLAGELGLGPKVNKAYGFRFRKTKRKILRQLIDELPVEKYGDAPKEGMYRNIAIHRFINHIFSIIFLLLAFRFLWLNDGKNYYFLEVFFLLGECFKHNWWVLVVAIFLLFVRARNTIPILDREQQIQDALQDYLKLHDQEVQKIIDNISTTDSEDLV